MMPSRVLRHEFNASESMSRVSIGAELTFAKLILAVDDFGRTDARPAALKALIFPMRNAISPAKLMAFLRELAADGCLQLYKSAGRPYLALTGWESHRGKTKRGADSKWPTPPPRIPGASGGFSLGEGEGEGKGKGVGVERGIGQLPLTDVSVRPSLFRHSLKPEEFAKLRLLDAIDSDTALEFAIATVRDWSIGGGNKRTDWLAVIRNAIREGWALKGFDNGTGRSGSGPKETPSDRVRKMFAERDAAGQVDAFENAKELN